jgi:hypothetical protein
MCLVCVWSCSVLCVCLTACCVQGIKLPLNSLLEVAALKIDKCKVSDVCVCVRACVLLTTHPQYMDSKKLPLWLVFENADTNAERDVTIIFKSGDDLRQVRACVTDACM